MKTFNTLYIDIALSRWVVSSKDIFESERKELHTGAYETTLSIEEFEKQLAHTILSHKGDGLELNIHSIKSWTYVNIELLLNEEDDVPNIDYLLIF